MPIAALLLGTVATVPASAATWDGVDPNGTSCISDGRAVVSAPVNGVHTWGTINLYYSPSCRTVWGVLNMTYPYQPGVAGEGNAAIHRSSDGHEMNCVTAGGSYGCHTKMLNDANTTSNARGTIDQEGNGTVPRGTTSFY